MKWFTLSAVALVAFAVQARADKPGNRPYVQSGADGVLYARCIPDEMTGAAVKRGDKDDLIETYDWYAEGGVTLGWSPIAGKVAVMASSISGQLSFFLGSKFLTQYTLDDLGKLGVEVAKRRTTAGPDLRAEFRVIGCEQVPGTNDYNFVIESKGKRFAFDIMTGKTRAEK